MAARLLLVLISSAANVVAIRMSGGPSAFAELTETDEMEKAAKSSMTPEEEAAKEGESCRYVTSAWCPPRSRNAVAYRKPEGPLCCFKSVAKDMDEPLPPVKKSSIEPEPVQEQGEPMPKPETPEEPKEEYMDEPLPPAKKPMETAPVKEETPLPPTKSSMAPGEEAAKEGESCRYVTSAWCPPGSRNAVAYRKPEGPLCCFKSVAKDMDEPLPPVKKSSIEPEPVQEQGEPMPEPETPEEPEDEDMDEPLPPVKKSSIESEPVQEQGEPMPEPETPEEPEDEDMDEPLPPVKKSSIESEPVQEQAKPMAAEPEASEDPDDEDEELEDEPAPPMKESSIKPEPVEEVEDSGANAAAMVACAKVGEKRKADCKHFKAKKHPSVPGSYTCAWKKMCHDRSGKVVAGADTTGGCGGMHLQARGVCVAVKV